jgi:hypothetical protein
MPESDKPRKPYDPTKRQRKFAAESNGAKAPHHPVARAKHLRGRPGILIATGSLTTGATVGYLLGRHSRKERAGVIKLYDPFTENTVDFEKVSVGGVVEGAKDVARAGQTAAVTGGRQLKAFATSKPVIAASAWLLTLHRVLQCVGSARSWLVADTLPTVRTWSTSLTASPSRTPPRCGCTARGPLRR